MKKLRYDKEEWKLLNKRGELITFGEMIYFPVLFNGNFKACVQRAKVKCLGFMLDERRGVLEPFVLTNSYILKLDDVYKKYSDAEGVITKWERKIVESIEENT